MHVVRWWRSGKDEEEVTRRKERKDEGKGKEKKELNGELGKAEKGENKEGGKGVKEVNKEYGNKEEGKGRTSIEENCACIVSQHLHGLMTTQPIVTDTQWTLGSIREQFGQSSILKTC